MKRYCQHRQFTLAILRSLEPTLVSLFVDLDTLSLRRFLAFLFVITAIPGGFNGPWIILKSFRAFLRRLSGRCKFRLSHNRNPRRRSVLCAMRILCSRLKSPGVTENPPPPPPFPPHLRSSSNKKTDLREGGYQHFMYLNLHGIPRKGTESLEDKDYCVLSPKILQDMFDHS